MLAGTAGAGAPSTGGISSVNVRFLPTDVEMNLELIWEFLARGW